MLSIEFHSQTNTTTSNGCSFLQLDAVTTHKIAWLLILAGVPVTTIGRSIHSKWAAAHSHCSDWLGNSICKVSWWESKSCEAMISVLCAPYHVPQCPTQPSSNWLSAISKQRSQSEFMDEQLLQRHRSCCAYHAAWFPTNPLLNRLIVCRQRTAFAE